MRIFITYSEVAQRRSRLKIFSVPKTRRRMPFRQIPSSRGIGNAVGCVRFTVTRQVQKEGTFVLCIVKGRVGCHLCFRGLLRLLFKTNQRSSTM
jgi:hypothetical protein